MLQRITIGILTVVFHGYDIIISLSYSNIVDGQKRDIKKLSENKIWKINVDA